MVGLNEERQQVIEPTLDELQVEVDMPRTSTTQQRK
jgi:hypothetical protein